MERFSAADLRARLGAPDVAEQLVTVDVLPDPHPKGDLVSATLSAYRSQPHPEPPPPGKPAFRKGAGAAAAASPAPPAARPTHRVNKYPGTCPLCHQRVEAESGRLDNQDGEWVTSHLTCPAPAQSTDTDVQAAAAAAVGKTSTADPTQVTIKAVTGQVYTGLHPGIYTLEDGVNGHRTFRVRVQSTEDSFAPGQTIVDHLTGPDNSPSSKDWTGFAWLRGTRLAIWEKHRGNADLVTDAKAFMDDPAAALESVTCIRCNATLTVPESVAAGMGPTCRNKGW